MTKTQIIPVLLLALVTFDLSQTNGDRYDSRPNQNETFVDKADSLFAPWSKGDTPGASVIVVSGQ